MYLKTLTIKGFKSFADPTTIELEPGITVIVGPNGSGKSNVVDAVAWVLGAQAPSNLRSARMEDVIFAGSSARAALGRAEVSLTIDNGSGRLPIGLSEVTIRRTLWRSGESEYAVNGTSCRLLDVQELLSDSGVGRQQHVIVSQGQLDAVLSASPEDRRAMIEEAAGVLKYRRRRERAERRLAATDADLARLHDLLGEVRRQLRPLERQALAARRHQALAGEHRAIHLYLAGRQLSDLDHRLEAAAAAGSEQDRRARQLHRDLAAVDQEAARTEMTIEAQHAAGLDRAIGDLVGLRERARGLAAVVAERRRSLERSLAAGVDEALLASLEAEATSVAEDLAGADAAVAELGPLAEELAREEARRTQEWAAVLDAGPPPSAVQVTADELRGRLGALRLAVERDRSEVTKAEEALASLEARQAGLRSQADRLGAQLSVDDQEELPLRAGVEKAAAQRAHAEILVHQAEALARAADQDQRSWTTRAEALALALAQMRTHGDLEHLSGLDGVLGPLNQLVEVDRGWEAAFEAALGEAVEAIVMGQVAAAVVALERMEQAGVSRMLLTVPAVAGADEAPRPASPGADEAPRPASPGAPEAVASTLAGHVRAGLPAVNALVESFLARTVVVEGDWRAGLELSLTRPHMVVVTRSGDRFGPEGWRIGSHGAAATRAALAEAEEEARAASRRAQAAEGELVRTQDQLGRADQAQAVAAQALAAIEGRRRATAEESMRIEAQLAGVLARRQSVESHLVALLARSRRDESEVAELEAALPAVEASEGEAAELSQRAAQRRQELEGHDAALRGRRGDLEVRAAGLEERRSLLTRRLVEIEGRLAGMTKAREELAGRRLQLEAAVRASTALIAMVGSCADRVDGEIARLADHRRHQQASLAREVEALAGLRAKRGALVGALEEMRDQRQSTEMALAEMALRQEAVIGSLQREMGAGAEEARAAPCPELAPGLSAREQADALDRELRLLGPINPLAVAELEASQERAAFLDGQLEDLREARKELSKVISAIDGEILGVFAGAYADVSRHFSELFATLFPGGAGSLSLTDPGNLLGTGIEVSARPAGKNVRRLSLLSGGERSLVALAFLAAVFQSRPSPFYLMDEVEAALDDVNLDRFLNLVDQFRSVAQLVIVTHQKRTMEVADSLYGVTMQAGGSSRVVSERVTARA